MTVPSRAPASPASEPERAAAPAALPDGAIIRLNRHTRVIDDGRVLVGGSPTRVARLAPRAVGLIEDRELGVRDPATRALAEHLIAAGLGDPVAASLPAAALDELTVVIPIRDRSAALDRLLASLPSGVAGTVVVDDASRDPDAVATVARRHGADVVPLPDNRGSAAARNAGLARVTTRFAAFIDSDVVVEPGALQTMLRHFADPAVALVAPRVLGLAREHPTWITRYEDARSSLDHGPEGSLVRPRSPLTWVSSTCLVARVNVLGDGFDEAMRSGEDVDLVWRLASARERVRFEPAATVRHEHRTRTRDWLGRKFFYGTGARGLASRHPREIAPVVLPPWGAGVLIALAAQRWWSLPLAAMISAVVAGRIARRVGPLAHPRRLAAQLTANGLVSTIAQGFALVLRHWWPLTALAALVSRRARRAALIAAIADTAWEYARVRPELDPLRFAVARRLDDLAYGAGVWWGALRGRSVRALLPAIVRTTKR